MSIKAIAAAAPCSRMTLHRILGRGCGGCAKTRRVKPSTASAILAIHVPGKLANVKERDHDAWQLDYETHGLPHGFDGVRLNLAWQARGNCRAADIPTWVFFPTRGDAETMEAALAVCVGCPVRRECLEYENRDVEIVLVGADSLDTIKQTHSHYFDEQVSSTPFLAGA